MHTYDQDTAIDLMDAQADMFRLLPLKLDGVDIFHFITMWLNSDSRAALDDGSPKLLYKSGGELLSWFINQDMGNEYRQSIQSYDYDPHVLHWVGLIYQLYCYKEKISSAELVKQLPPETLYSMYYPWHELSDLGAVKRIKEYIYS